MTEVTKRANISIEEQHLRNTQLNQTLKARRAEGQPERRQGAQTQARAQAVQDFKSEAFSTLSIATGAALEKLRDAMPETAPAAPAAQ